VQTASKNLGIQVRRRRNLKRMRLADLAEKVGCSESMLSKIENGKANPSLNTLSKIATTLEVDVRDFFTANDDRVIICKKGQHPSLDTSTYPIDPSIVFKAITPHTPDQLLQVDIHVIPPDKGTVGPLSHEGQEAGMVLEGRLELTVNNVVYNLCAGDSFCFNSNHPHRYRNPGNSTTQVIWINSPPYLDPSID